MSFSENVIEVRGLGKRLRDATGELVILQDIDFSVAKGQSVAIVGASGSGKSTLLGLMAGLDTATDGTITLLGKSLGELDEEGRAALRRGAVGFVFQSFQLMPHLTALENVMLPLELLGETSDVRNRAVKLLEQVGLGSRLTHYPKQLSGGEQQRVALARAFVTAPSVLFADEPTGSLDTATGERVIDLMFSLNEASGATLVLVTHDLAIAQRCDATVQLAGGRLVDGASV
ncbi:MAG: ABC transporter ATP-binding protein [Pandoraea sp.]|nr:ABC transporter ATP-binding protein [Pandoraea sp.]MDR3399723.1 ABC transporter ATP-binding protein [Pandoraea sp.]